MKKPLQTRIEEGKYLQLKAIAEKNKRSLAAEVALLIERGLAGVPHLSGRSEAGPTKVEIA